MAEPCMIWPVREFFRKNLGFVLWATAGALCLRLVIVYKLAYIAGDSLVYADIAKNLLNHGVFGLSGPNLHPTLIRLPGYPMFMALVFRFFGQDNFRAVMLAEAALDVGSCFLMADVARRMISVRAARLAFLLAAFCPFTANYAGTPLTEAPSVFFIILSLQQAVMAFDGVRQAPPRYGNWVFCGLAVAAAILLRPDGGLVLGSIGLAILLRLWSHPAERKKLLAGGLLLTAVALAPLVPWTIRNWRTFHVFQPLVTTEATDPGEFIARGWQRWLQTWLADYSSVEDVGFHADVEPIDIRDIPARAFDSAAERAYVSQLLDEYNATTTMTPSLDRRFGELARQKVRSHRLRYYMVLPVLRLTGMWFRPRTELLPLDTHWWAWRVDPWNTAISGGLMAINCVLVGMAILGIFRGGPVRYMSLLLIYPAVRSLFLLTTGAAEDRYTLECFPFIFLLAARCLASCGKLQSQRLSRA